MSQPAAGAPFIFGMGLTFLMSGTETETAGGA